MIFRFFIIICVCATNRIVNQSIQNHFVVNSSKCITKLFVSAFQHQNLGRNVYCNILIEIIETSLFDFRGGRKLRITGSNLDVVQTPEVLIIKDRKRYTKVR